jgi:hypothetical protein
MWIIFPLISASLVEQDLFSKPKFEVFIDSNLVFDGQEDLNQSRLTLEMMDCLIPKTVEEKEKVEYERIPNLQLAVEKVLEMPCLVQIRNCITIIDVEEGRFWAYEFCSQRSLRQYHPLPADVEPKKDEIYELGVSSISYCSDIIAGKNLVLVLKPLIMEPCIF